MRVHVAHGQSSKGAKVHRVGFELQRLGHVVSLHRYEVRHFWSYFTRSGGPSDPDLVSDGRALAGDMDEGDCLIAHSNGAVVWQESIRWGAKWGKVILFSPACTSDRFHYSSDCLEECHTFFNPEDKAILLGSWLKKIPFTDHPYGKAGRRGIVWNAEPPDFVGDWNGIDPRFFNYPVPSSKFLSLDHSHYFDTEHLDGTMRNITAILGGS